MMNFQSRKRTDGMFEELAKEYNAVKAAFYGSLKEESIDTISFLTDEIGYFKKLAEKYPDNSSLQELITVLITGNLYLIRNYRKVADDARCKSKAAA